MAKNIRHKQKDWKKSHLKGKWRDKPGFGSMYLQQI